MLSLQKWGVPFALKSEKKNVLFELKHMIRVTSWTLTKPMFTKQSHHFPDGRWLLAFRKKNLWPLLFSSAYAGKFPCINKYPSLEVFFLGKFWHCCYRAERFSLHLESWLEFLATHKASHVIPHAQNLLYTKEMRLLCFWKSRNEFTSSLSLKAVSFEQTQNVVNLLISKILKAIECLVLLR